MRAIRLAARMFFLGPRAAVPGVEGLIDLYRVNGKYL